ncbi:hypothetical protein CHH83_17240 [Bacillus sp. 7586-K]|nr:hypothetical protein CHH83_17240 [Bacillus sp. 7586-K]
MYKQKNELYIQTMKKIIKDNNISFNTNLKAFLIILTRYYQGNYNPFKTKNNQLLTNEIITLLKENTINQYSEQCEAILIKINDLFENGDYSEVKKIFATHKMGKFNTIDELIISLINSNTFECDLSKLTVYDYYEIVRHWSYMKNKYYRNNAKLNKTSSRGDLNER